MTVCWFVPGVQGTWFVLVTAIFWTNYVPENLANSTAGLSLLFCWNGVGIVLLALLALVCCGYVVNHDEANRDGTLDTRQEIVGLAAETSTNGLESEMCTWRIEHSRVDSPSLEADAFFPNFTRTHDHDLEIT